MLEDNSLHGTIASYDKTWWKCSSEPESHMHALYSPPIKVCYFQWKKGLWICRGNDSFIPMPYRSAYK